MSLSTSLFFFWSNCVTSFVIHWGSFYVRHDCLYSCSTEKRIHVFILECGPIYRVQAIMFQTSYYNAPQQIRKRHLQIKMRRTNNKANKCERNRPRPAFLKLPAVTGMTWRYSIKKKQFSSCLDRRCLVCRSMAMSLPTADEKSSQCSRTASLGQ